MNSRWFITNVWIVVVVTTLSLTANAEESTSQWQRNLDEAWQQSKDESRPLLMVFTHPTCRFCAKIMDHTFADNAVRSNLDASFVAVAVDAQDQPALVEKLAIRVYPTTVVITPEAKVIESIRGYVSASEMNQRLTALTARLASAE